MMIAITRLTFGYHKVILIVTEDFLLMNRKDVITDGHYSLR